MSLTKFLAIKLRVAFKFRTNVTLKCAANVVFFASYKQLTCDSSKIQGQELSALLNVACINDGQLVLLIFSDCEI